MALQGASIAVLVRFGRMLPSLADRAEPARIGRDCASESMRVSNPGSGCHDEAAGPSMGHDTLFDFPGRLLRVEAAIERGDRAVFRRSADSDAP